MISFCDRPIIRQCSASFFASSENNEPKSSEPEENNKETNSSESDEESYASKVCRWTGDNFS